MIDLPKRKEVKTESPLEDLLLASFIRYGLYPEMQFHIGKYRVDFAFPKKMLVVEVDGYEFHKDRKTEDRQRDDELGELGWKVLRFAGAIVYRQSDEIAESILKEKPLIERTVKFRRSEEDGTAEDCIRQKGEEYGITYTDEEIQEIKMKEDAGDFEITNNWKPLKFVLKDIWKRIDEVHKII